MSGRSYTCELASGDGCGVVHRSIESAVRHRLRTRIGGRVVRIDGISLSGREIRRYARACELLRPTLRR